VGKLQLSVPTCSTHDADAAD